jgi:hypothetical protein
MLQSVKRGLVLEVYVSVEAVIQRRARRPAIAQTLVFPTPGVLSVHLSGQDLVARYEANVRALLTQPRSIAFLFAGGLLWRIALQYASPEFLRQALTGPSAFVLDRVNGSVKEFPTGPFIRDELPEEDVDVLLGLTAKQGKVSVWPQPSLVSGHDTKYWTGEWSQANEEWFVKTHAAFLARGSAHSAKEWATKLRPRTGNKSIRDAEDSSEQAATADLNILTQELGDSSNVS